MKIFTRSILSMSLLFLAFSLKAGGAFLVSPNDYNLNPEHAEPTGNLSQTVNTTYADSPDGEPVEGVQYRLAEIKVEYVMIPIVEEVPQTSEEEVVNEDELLVRGIRTESIVPLIEQSNPTLTRAEIRGDRTFNPIQVRGSRAIDPAVISNAETSGERLQTCGGRIIIRGSRIPAKYYVDGVSITDMKEASNDTEEELQSTPEIQVWPNPSSGTLNLKAIIPGEEKAELRIISTEGRIVRQITLEGMDTKFENQLFLDRLPDGVYQINIVTKDKVLNKPWVLQR